MLQKHDENSKQRENDEPTASCKKDQIFFLQQPVRNFAPGAKRIVEKWIALAPINDGLAIFRLRLKQRLVQILVDLNCHSQHFGARITTAIVSEIPCSTMRTENVSHWLNVHS